MALTSIILFFILIPVGLAYTLPQYCTVSVDEIILENITGADPETFCLGDRVRVSAEVSLMGTYDPVVFLDLYVDGRFYESKTVHIPLGSSKTVTFDKLIYTSDFGVTDPSVEVIASVDCDANGDENSKFFTIQNCPNCLEVYLNNYRCSGNYVQQEYQYPDCSYEWRYVEYCRYGCSYGRCFSEPIRDCHIDLLNKKIIDTQIMSGNYFGVLIKLGMDYQANDPAAKVTVSVDRDIDPSMTKTYYFTHSGDSYEGIFTFSTDGWEAGTYNVYVEAEGENNCGSLPKTYVGSVLVKDVVRAPTKIVTSPIRRFEILKVLNGYRSSDGSFYLTLIIYMSLLILLVLVVIFLIFGLSVLNRLNERKVPEAF